MDMDRAKIIVKNQINIINNTNEVTANTRKPSYSKIESSPLLEKPLQS